MTDSEWFGDDERPSGKELEIAISAAAIEFALDHGCRVYVWDDPVSDGYGLLRVGIEEPESSSTFVRCLTASGVEIFVSDDLALPMQICIERRRFPLDHLTAFQPS